MTGSHEGTGAVGRRLGLRQRLTIAVTLVFAVAATLGGLAAVDELERRLAVEIRATAEDLLLNYVQGPSSDGDELVADAPGTTSFFFLGPDGEELAEQDFETEALGEPALTDEIESAAFECVPEDLLTEADELAPTTGDAALTCPEGYVAADLDALAGCVDCPKTDAPQPGQSEVLVPGPIEAVDRGPDVVAVAHPVVGADGEVFRVGVETPIAPAAASLDAATDLLQLGIPVLVVVVALLSWLLTGFALRPVEAMRREAAEIGETDLHRRLPVPGGGDELAALARTMNAMLTRIDDDQQQRKRFTADAAHELRSPLAASRAQLEVALAAGDDADWRRTAGTVLTEQESMSRLVDDLLALAVLDERRGLDHREADLDEVVHSALPVAPPGVTLSVSAEPVRVHGDPRLLGRAVRNLVDNALRHATSVVSVTVHGDGAGATITVDDDGPGVPVDERARVFERFASIDDARRYGGGAGLGLAIVAGVAAAHHGTAAVEESPSGGARFVLRLPRTPPTAARNASP